MTPTLAATLAALAAAVLTAALYGGACWAVPFTRCRPCQGTGYRHRQPSNTARHAGRTGRHSRPQIRLGKLRTCRRCRGVGTHLRTGRKVYNYARRIHRDATTTTMPPARDPKQPPTRPHW